MTNTKINMKGRLLEVSKPLIMGIVNVTPDSFYDGGQSNSTETALQQASDMITEGADILDIGGMSSRPGAEIITPEEEWERVAPVILAIKKAFPKIVISIDTLHSYVAEKAIQAGADIINDISGGNHDEKIIDVAIRYNVPYIMMHMQGTPKTMQDNPQYEDVTLDILKELNLKINTYRAKGLKDIIIDPGFGFGKTIEENYQLLKKLSVFKITDCPILVGISRKSMIYKVLDNSPQEALNGTTALHMVALQNGASILRVHDVKEAKEVEKLYEKLSH